VHKAILVIMAITTVMEIMATIITMATDIMTMARTETDGAAMDYPASMPWMAQT